MQEVLSAVQPFSYLSVVRSHGWAQLEPFRWEPEAKTLSYILRLDTGRVVRLVFRPADKGLFIQFPDDLEKEEMEQCKQAAVWMFGLEMNFGEFYDLVRDEPKLKHVIPEARGRVLRAPTLFEDVVKTILTTNVQWGGTKRMARELVQAFGDPLPGEPDLCAFPAPERLAAVDLETYQKSVRHGYRAPYLWELAQRVASGELDLESLRDSSTPTPELRKQLLAIKGVGGYAAANLLMILGRYDYLPIDSWGIKMVSNEFFEGEPVSPAQIEEIFVKWGKYKGLAFWFWKWENTS